MHQQIIKKLIGMLNYVDQSMKKRLGTGDNDNQMDKKKKFFLRALKAGGLSGYNFVQPYNSRESRFHRRGPLERKLDPKLFVLV